MQARKVARELATALDDPTRFDWPTNARRWLLMLALPKRKVRVKDPARAARKTTVKELDHLCRTIVFARDGNKCRRCGTTSGLFDWAHILSRRHPKTRHHLLNSLVLCRACHMEFHDRPVDGAYMIRDLIGEATYATLKALSTGAGRADNAMTRLYLEQEAKRLGVEI